MGINNFCKLIDPVSPPDTTPQPFDSILVDVQSFLYVAIEFCLESNEDLIFREIAKLTWEQLSKMLNLLFSHNVHDKDSCTLVLAFDGEGVPMKWPTQRQRRAKIHDINGKNLYRYSLFGKNKIALQVERYILSRLKNRFKLRCSQLDVVLCGCQVAGEGEHKLFHVAEALSQKCRRPIIVSVDQDVFVLAFKRIKRYDALQIYRYGKFYNVNQFLHHSLPYESARLLTVSNLFGNDFIPPLVGITPINAPTLHAKLSPDENDDEEDDEAHVIANFICNLENNVRFERTPHVDRAMIEGYWMTHLWINDYYTSRNFKQKYLENPIFDSFDRNQLLTGLSNASYSSQVLQDVRKKYENLVTKPVDESTAVTTIFSDEVVRKKLENYWEKSHQKNSPCVQISLKKH